MSGGGTPEPSPGAGNVPGCLTDLSDCRWLFVHRNRRGFAGGESHPHEANGRPPPDGSLVAPTGGDSGRYGSLGRRVGSFPPLGGHACLGCALPCSRQPGRLRRFIPAQRRMYTIIWPRCGANPRTLAQKSRAAARPARTALACARCIWLLGRRTWRFARAQHLHTAQCTRCI